MMPLPHCKGGIFQIDAVSGALNITDDRFRVVTITVTDIAAFNGVVHMIDKAILPKPRQLHSEHKRGEHRQCVADRCFQF